MMADDASRDSQIVVFTRTFAWVTRFGFAFLPAGVIAYLYFFASPALRLESPLIHEASAALALLLGAFVSLVTWHCYRESGEPFLHWLAQGLTGFTVVYLPHGLFTRFAGDQMWLFMLYGPASRFVLIGCLFIAILRYGAPPDAKEERDSWLTAILGISVFTVINVLTATVAFEASLQSQMVRLITEVATIVLALISGAVMHWRRTSSPLMTFYLFAIACFGQSSVALLLATPWDHIWWAAHIIFTIGLFTLSYGIVQAFHTTRAFATVYSQEEIMRKLECANAELARLAATDTLTGAASRRHFLQRADEELARAQRNGESFALLMMDIDHFKSINDQHGHIAGDEALRIVAARVREILRLPDLFGRLGGEEFAVLLPGLERTEAAVVAERIRQAMEETPIQTPSGLAPVTVSIGVAIYRVDGDSIDALTSCADKRLYLAKKGGRNRVVCESPANFHEPAERHALSMP